VLKSHCRPDLLDALEALLNGGTFFGGDAGRRRQKKNPEPWVEFPDKLAIGLGS